MSALNISTLTLKNDSSISKKNSHTILFKYNNTIPKGKIGNNSQAK